MTEHDHLMFHHAANRGPVTVNLNGRLRTATLIAWKPHRRDNGKVHRNVARVRFASGRELTIKPASNVTITPGASD